MSNKAHSILQELYKIDPDFEKHEAELTRLVEKMLAAKPDIEPNAAFLKDLRRQLVRQARVLNEVHEEVKESHSFGLVNFLNRFFYPFASGVMAMLLVVITVWQPGQVIINGNPFEVEEADVMAIDENVEAIDAGLSTCIKTVIELFGDSTEGGSATFYVKNDQIQKLKEELLGETGKTVNKYYFKEGELIYIIHERHTYNRPIYWDEARAEEFNDDQVFDPEETEILQSTYYIQGGMLLYWIDENGEAMSLEDDITQLLRGDFYVARSGELLTRLEAGEGRVVE